MPRPDSNNQMPLDEAKKRGSDIQPTLLKVQRLLTAIQESLAGGGGSGQGPNVTVVGDTVGLAKDASVGAKGETPATTDTASSGLNGLFKRFLVQFTAFRDRFPVSLGQKVKASSLPVTIASDQDALAITAASLPLPNLASTSTLQTDQNVLIGAVTEAAPGTDTASSGLNGRLQRIAQRLTSLISLFPVSLGQKTSAGSLSVVLPSDGTLPLPTGAAQENTLGLLSAKLPASLGQKANAGSLSVAASTELDAKVDLLATKAKQDNLIAQAGAPTDVAWDGAAASATETSILKFVSVLIAAVSGKLPATLGQKTGAASMATVPASDVIAPVGVSRASASSVATVTTVNPGTTFTAFGAVACNSLDIWNTATGAVLLEVRIGGSGSTLFIPADTGGRIVGITNASGVQVRRADVSNTPVTVTAQAITS